MIVEVEDVKKKKKRASKSEVMDDKCHLLF